MLERKRAKQTNCEKGCTRPGSQPRETHLVLSPSSLEIDMISTSLENVSIFSGGVMWAINRLCRNHESTKSLCA